MKKCLILLVGLSILLFNVYGNDINATLNDDNLFINVDALEISEDDYLSTSGGVLAEIALICALTPVDEIIIAGATVAGIYVAKKVKDLFVSMFAEHKKGARNSTEEQHEKGQSRVKRDKQGGEKGDSRRKSHR